MTDQPRSPIEDPAAADDAWTDPADRSPEPPEARGRSEHPTGTNGSERIATAERNRFRTDQHMGDGRDPSFAHAQSDGHEMVPSSGTPAARN